MGVKYEEKHVLGHSEGQSDKESDSDPEEFIEEDVAAIAVEELCDIPDLTEVERTSEETCILRSAICKLEDLCNIPNDNEVEPTSEDTKQEELRRAIYEKEKEMMDEILKKANLEELSNIPNHNEVESTSNEE